MRGCGGTAKGPRAVLSCAGAYVSGAAGSNECPAGSVRIETAAACGTAAAAAGKTAGSPFVANDSIFPRGCYHTTSSNAAYFNTHAVGAGLSYAQLLCAALAATTGAPLRRRRCTDARSACRHHTCPARHSRAVCVIHGRHIDAHTYTNRYTYTHMYTYDSDGAPRRCRAAHGSGGGRRAGEHGRVRVLRGCAIT